MQEALREARKSFDINEVPIGAVIVRDGEIISKAYNTRNSDSNPLHHAEILAINKAAKVIGDWRLEDCTMYVTLEPCPMCAGAIVQARIPKVVFGSKSHKAGACGTLMNILQNDKLNHKAEIIEGILEEDCSNLIKDFFKALRAK
jgi:tRNA(adenine34) deaminase